RIRPIFVLLGGRFGKKDKSQLKYIAVALELIHMASLVHDDVIDNADKRRGMETINTRFGNKAAMYTGDYLFSRALTSMVHMENPKVHQVLSYTILELCRGEIEQIRDKFNFDQGFKCYLKRIKRKTALLIASSCQLGAITTDATEDIQKILFLYG